MLKPTAIETGGKTRGYSWIEPISIMTTRETFKIINRDHYMINVRLKKKKVIKLLKRHNNMLYSTVEAQG